MSKRPILVTGAIRSGTTWVGRMIAKSPDVGYIHEPFNPWDPLKKRGICKVQVPLWFFYVTEETAKPRLIDAIENSLAFRYNLFRAISGIRSKKGIERVQREYGDFRAYRASGARALLKDPFAVVSAEWFAKRFDMHIVILIRHPAAFVSSIKRLKWGLPFQHLLAQSRLMEDYLHPFEARMKEVVAGEHDLIDRAILLWNIVYYVVDQHRQKHPDWIFLRHEDLSMDPVHHFDALYND